MHNWSLLIKHITGYWVNLFPQAIAAFSVCSILAVHNTFIVLLIIGEYHLYDWPLFQIVLEALA